MKTPNSFNCQASGNPLPLSPKQYLIITADDFGYAMNRDDGILRCFTNGVVTRASLLVNGSSTRISAVKRAREHGLPLGIHLNLTEGEPVVKIEKSTLRRSGCDFFRGKFGFREALQRGEIDLDDVKTEINGQIETFVKIVGYPPNHVDGHQHIHILPRIRDIIAEIMNLHDLNQIRIPFENDLDDWFDGNVNFYNQVFQDATQSVDIYQQKHIRFPESFMGITLMGKHMNAERIIQKLRAITSLPGASICEFMVHPGYSCMHGVGGCGEGPDEFARSREREHELEVLCGGKVKELLADLNIEFMF